MACFHNHFMTRAALGDVVPQCRKAIWLAALFHLRELFEVDGGGVFLQKIVERHIQTKRLGWQCG
jgi:hypothetical protein